MSENTNLDGIKVAIVNGAQQAFVELIKSTLVGVGGDVAAYGTLLSQEYTRYLWKSYRENDDTAARNLKHLKAQALELAIKRGIIVSRESMEKLLAGLEWGAGVALKVLMAAAVAA